MSHRLTRLLDPHVSTLAIVGLGYVGLPLSLAFGAKRVTVGFDTNARRIAQLQRAYDASHEYTPDDFRQASLTKFTTDLSRLKTCQIFIICVPTPIDAESHPDLGPLKAASICVSQALKPGDLVIYESTVYPGTTEEICVPLLEVGAKLRFNRDFFCGYSPERLSPGNPEHRLTAIRKITSGSTPETAHVVDQIYRQIISAGTWQAPSIRVAEAAKIVENIQRDVNIALMNELALLFNRLGIDTQDVIDAAATKWNFQAFRPGLVGGHCIGVDPYYLLHKSQSVGYLPELIQTARRVNNRVIAHIVERITCLLAERGIALSQARILQLGLTFKENCADLRNSQAAELARLFQQQGANVDVCDPYADPQAAMHRCQIALFSQPPAAAYHAVILAVAHQPYQVMTAAEIRGFCQTSGVVYDIKSVWPRSVVTARL